MSYILCKKLPDFCLVASMALFGDAKSQSQDFSISIMIDEQFYCGDAGMLINPFFLHMKWILHLAVKKTSGGNIGISFIVLERSGF
jgi:hypothetical protein